MTLDTTTSLSCLILGRPVVIAAPDLEARTAVAAIFRGFATPCQLTEAARYRIVSSRRRGWLVEAHGRPTFSGAGLLDALLALEWQVVNDALAGATTFLHLHGAALCTPSGAASVLILGESGSGKTTLALALMARGYLPFADDVVVVDPDTLTPRLFPRAFHVDGQARRLVEGLSRPPPWDFDNLPVGFFIPPRWSDHPAKVGAIFFPTLHPEDAPSITRLSIAATASALLPFSATLRQSPAMALAVAARLTSCASGYALRAGQLEATADIVAEAAADPRGSSL